MTMVQNCLKTPESKHSSPGFFGRAPNQAEIPMNAEGSLDLTTPYQKPSSSCQAFGIWVLFIREFGPTPSSSSSSSFSSYDRKTAQQRVWEPFVVCWEEDLPFQRIHATSAPGNKKSNAMVGRQASKQACNHDARYERTIETCLGRLILNLNLRADVGQLQTWPGPFQNSREQSMPKQIRV